MTDILMYNTEDSLTKIERHINNGISMAVAAGNGGAVSNQQVLDIFATSIDHDGNSESTNRLL